MVVYGREDLSWPCCQPWSSSSTCVCGRVLYETGSTTPTHGGRIRYLWAEFFVLLFSVYEAKEWEGESRHYRATSASHTYATRQLRHLSIVFPPNFAAKIGVRPSRAPPFNAGLSWLNLQRGPLLRKSFLSVHPPPHHRRYVHILSVCF